MIQLPETLHARASPGTMNKVITTLRNHIDACAAQCFSHNKLRLCIILPVLELLVQQVSEGLASQARNAPDWPGPWSHDVMFRDPTFLVAVVGLLSSLVGLLGEAVQKTDSPVSNSSSRFSSDRDSSSDSRMKDSCSKGQASAALIPLLVQASADCCMLLSVYTASLAFIMDQGVPMGPLMALTTAMPCDALAAALQVPLPPRELHKLTDAALVAACNILVVASSARHCNSAFSPQLGTSGLVRTACLAAAGKLPGSFEKVSLLVIAFNSSGTYKPDCGPELHPPIPPIRCLLVSEPAFQQALLGAAMVFRHPPVTEDTLSNFRDNFLHALSA